MIAKCIGNSQGYLTNERERKAYARNIHQEEVCLQLGKEYKVYGVTFRDGENIPWLLVCEDINEPPKPHLSAFFEVIDNCIPSGWAFTSGSNNIGGVAVLPKRWADDPFFLEKLYNEEEDALNYFHQL